MRQLIQEMQCKLDEVEGAEDEWGWEDHRGGKQKGGKGENTEGEWGWEGHHGGKQKGGMHENRVHPYGKGFSKGGMDRVKFSHCSGCQVTLQQPPPSACALSE